MEIGVLPEQEKKEIDDDSFLEGIWNKIETGVKAVDFTDHVDYTDPLGWETLGQRWGEKTIGKKWREGQMQDVWNAVPEAWRPNITKAAMATAESVGTAWQNARTVDNWFNPLDVAAAGTARSIELATLPFEGLAQLTSAGTGLDIELSRVVVDFVPVGGLINRTKLLRRAGIAKKAMNSFSPGSLDDLLQKALKSGNKEEMKRILNLMEESDASFIRENEILSNIQNKANLSTPMQRYTNARNRLKREGWLRRDDSVRPEPIQTSRGRGRSGNALMVNDLSNALNFNKEGQIRTAKILEGLTETEKAKLGAWHRHHIRPLSQHSWLLQGLEPAELKKAQDYSYQRMSAGGDVLNNQRITPEGPHVQAHRSLNAMIGDMRKKAGDSIANILDPGITPQQFIKIPTFAGRKAIISRFFDATNAIDEKIGNIMDAIDISRAKGATITLEEAGLVFNKIDNIEDIGILDDFVKALNENLDQSDINALAKINEALNFNEQQWIKLDKEFIKTTSGYKKLKLKEQMDILDKKVDDLLNRKEKIVPQNFYQYLQRATKN